MDVVKKKNRMEMKFRNVFKRPNTKLNQIIIINNNIKIVQSKNIVCIT